MTVKPALLQSDKSLFAAFSTEKEALASPR
jgi:hypothetical protein